eukprot:scaffold31055_cov154-Skeletonema_menzelii.AAC.1
MFHVRGLISIAKKGHPEVSIEMGLSRRSSADLPARHTADAHRYMQDLDKLEVETAKILERGRNYDRRGSSGR